MNVKTAHKKDTLLTHEEAMSVLKITRHTLYWMRKRGEIKGVKVGKYLRFKSAEIERLINA